MTPNPERVTARMPLMDFSPETPATELRYGPRPPRQLDKRALFGTSGLSVHHSRPAVR